MNLIPPRSSQPIYPERDGKPLAENTKQCRWIFILFGNIQALVQRCIDIFVAADLLWYPVEGEPSVSTAPDVMIVFGRPKGDRGSYKQWEEDNIPVTVAFEVRSPSNTEEEMIDKHLFYEENGVEEYYVYDPERNKLKVYLRRGELLLEHRQVDGFVSPRLGIRFDLSGPEMVVYAPDGQRFLSFEELKALYEQAQQRSDKAQREAEKAQEQTREAQRVAEKAQEQTREAQRVAEKAQEQSRDAQREAEKAQEQTREAQRAAEKAQEQAREAHRHVTRLAELSRKARQQQATPEELQELERLENESLPSL